MRVGPRSQNANMNDMTGTPERETSVFCKEILVNSLEFQHPTCPNPDPVFDHEFGQAAAVDQYDALRDAGSEFLRLGREA